MTNRIDLEKTKIHLLAVSVAAELSEVKEQGEAISLEAMNAKVLVARAGTMALGFKPLTDFMVQLAADIILLVTQIEKEALMVAHESVIRLRTSMTVKYAEKAYQLSSLANAHWGEGLQAFVTTVKQRDDETVTKLLSDARRLINLLDQIDSKMMAANAVSASFRIESAAIDDRYSQSFRAVADNLETYSSAIQRTVKSSLSLLSRELRN